MVREINRTVARSASLDHVLPDEDGDGKPDAPAGHGTHVAGLVSSVAAGAKMWPDASTASSGSCTIPRARGCRASARDRGSREPAVRSRRARPRSVGR